MTDQIAEAGEPKNEQSISWSTFEFYDPFNSLLLHTKFDYEGGSMVVIEEEFDMIQLDSLSEIIQEMNSAEDFLLDRPISQLFSSILDENETITDAEFLRLKPMLLQVVRSVQLRDHDEIRNS